MSRVSYDSNRLIPAPLVEFSKVYQKSEDGTKIGSVWQISITGTMISYMGSPSSNGTFWTSGGFPPDEIIDENSRLASFFRKQEAIRTLFAEDGKSLEWQSEDASAPIKCNPRITGITFPSDIWNIKCQYTITAEADILYINGQAYGEDDFPSYIESGVETWQLETDESTPEAVNLPRTYRLTHSVQAKGKRFFKDNGELLADAWIQARNWVIPKLGLDSTKILSSGVQDLPSFYGGYNHIRSENIDELGGNYGITETWILTSGTALETFDISTTNSVDTGLTRVEINGTITGLEVRDANMQLTTTKYTNANTKFTDSSGIALGRAQAYTGINLNVVPLSMVVGKNPTTGVISYSFGYDNRPSNIIPGTKLESISINDALPTDIIAIVPVLGRTKGPVLQPIYTTRERRRTLDVELIVSPPSFDDLTYALNGARPSSNPEMSSAITTLINAANPINNGANKSYLEDNNERWEAKDGRFSFTKTWVWEP